MNTITIEDAIYANAIMLGFQEQEILNPNLLDSAISRPFSGMMDIEFYDTPQKKAAAVIESVLINHPFKDGNKRTGFVLALLLLMQNGLCLNATEDEKYDFVISIASGLINYDQILEWFENKTTFII